MTKKLKKRLRRILLGAVVFCLAVLIHKLIPSIGNFVLIFYLAAYGIVGGDVVKKAVTNIARGQIFDENFLMLIATVGAFFVGEYPEAVAVMLFYQVGEWFQSFAVNNSRKSIKELMNIRPDYAVVLRGEEEIEVDPEEVAVGEIILVKPGERVPLDGKVVKGSCSLDTMALTGESIPRDVMTGDEVISGCIDLNSVIEVEVTKEFSQSTVSKILDLVENASSHKAVTEQFITRFARYYTPVVVILATLLAVIPSLIVGNFTTWLYRALSFLVISCPCALVISVPLSFFGGIGGAGKEGILIKGSNYLEILAKAETVVMDKTGTLTKGTFEVSEIVAQKIVFNRSGKNSVENESGLTKENILEFAAYAEIYSNHPISKSLQRAYGKHIRKEEIINSEEKAGMGVITEWNKTVIYAGNEKLMKWLVETKCFVTENNLDVKKTDNIKESVAAVEEIFVVEKAGTICHVAIEKEEVIEYLGYIVISDEIKEDAKAAIDGMMQEGIKRIVMLTGDALNSAKKVAEELGIKEYHAGLLPGDKVNLAERLLQEKQENKMLIFVGDGMNDAPVLARADIGIAMGGLGSDAAIEAADIVIMNDQPSKIATAMKISRKTLRIVKQNIVFAIGIKVVVLVLAALGMASMWAAVFADVGVAFLAILNAMRAMKVKNRYPGRRKMSVLLFALAITFGLCGCDNVAKKDTEPNIILQEKEETLDKSQLTWQEAYVEKVKEFEDGYQFNLIYINEDEIPELVVDYAGYYVSVFSWKQDLLVTVMDTFPYGAMGNAGYDYLPKQNVIFNCNHDLAGAISYETYMRMDDDFRLICIYDKDLSVWKFRDLNNNYQIDDGEAIFEEEYYYYGDKEITAEEYQKYGIQGEYEFIHGIWSVEEIVLQLNS